MPPAMSSKPAKRAKSAKSARPAKAAAKALKPIWSPSPEAIERAQVTQFAQLVARKHGESHNGLCSMVENQPLGSASRNLAARCR